MDINRIPDSSTYVFRTYGQFTFYFFTYLRTGKSFFAAEDYKVSCNQPDCRKYQERCNHC